MHDGSEQPDAEPSNHLFSHERVSERVSERASDGANKWTDERVVRYFHPDFWLF